MTLNAELVPRTLAPGMVPIGFAEHVLEQIVDLAPEQLYDVATTFAALAQKWNGHGAEKREIKSAQMFVEIELGQRMGPNPGPQAGPGRGHENGAHEHRFLPKERVKDFRRYFGHRDFLIEQVRNGALSRRSLLLAVDQREAQDRPAPTVEDLHIHAGDFRDVLAAEPMATLILTDPPYPVEYLPLWDDLGKYASDALLPGGSLVAYCGQSILPDALELLGSHLRYWWTIALTHGQTDMIPGKWVSAGWKPLLWFVKDHRAGRTMLPDRIAGSAPRKTIPTGDGDDWAQGVEELEPIISALTAPGDLIIDPFAGSGTVGIAATRFGRRFLGAELAGAPS